MTVGGLPCVRVPFLRVPGTWPAPLVQSSGTTTGTTEPPAGGRASLSLSLAGRDLAVPLESGHLHTCRGRAEGGGETRVRDAAPSRDVNPFLTLRRELVVHGRA